MSEGERGYAKGRERREAILTAANDVFAAQGFRGASLATVATRVDEQREGRVRADLDLELAARADDGDVRRTAAAMAARPRRRRHGTRLRGLPRALAAAGRTVTARCDIVRSR